LDDGNLVVFEELGKGCALIRELRCYGKLSSVGENGKHIQHMGLGKTLMNRAELLAKEKGYNKIAVISGEGTKPYYRKLGYFSSGSEGDFMMLNIE
jgi:elongator complex protein 3